jgi:hypothetical protein
MAIIPSSGRVVGFDSLVLFCVLFLQHKLNIFSIFIYNLLLYYKYNMVVYTCNQYPVRKLILVGDKVEEIILYKSPTNGVPPPSTTSTFTSEDIKSAELKK